MTEDDLEKLLEELQQKIEYAEGETYSKAVIRECKNPSNFGVLDNPDAIGEIKGPCGDTMKIYLRVEKRKIKDACFWTDGCGTSVACGSMLTKMIRGKTVDELYTITSEDLNNALDGLPEDHVHCTILAVNTLRKAIKNYNNE